MKRTHLYDHKIQVDQQTSPSARGLLVSKNTFKATVHIQTVHKTRNFHY